MHTRLTSRDGGDAGRYKNMWHGGSAANLTTEIWNFEGGPTADEGDSRKANAVSTAPLPRDELKNPQSSQNRQSSGKPS